MDVPQIWKLIVRYSCQVRNASDCLHSKMLILFRISEVVPKIRGIKMHFDGSDITICNMFNAHRTSHIAHRTSHIHMLMIINIYVCCHEVYLSNEVARWNQSAHCKCNGKGIKGKISNRNNVVFLNSHRITRNAHEIRNNVHIIIILWYSRANKTLIHNALQCHINFFFHAEQM